jgi:hypothetical protein
MPGKPYGIGIEPFSNRWKTAEKMENLRPPPPGRIAAA